MPMKARVIKEGESIRLITSKIETTVRLVEGMGIATNQGALSTNHHNGREARPLLGIAKVSDDLRVRNRPSLTSFNPTMPLLDSFGIIMLKNGKVR